MEREDLRTLLRGYVEGEGIYDALSDLTPRQLAAVNQLLRPRLRPIEPREVEVDERAPRVMETARPDERAAAGVDESAARWRGFSDAELRALRQMSSQRSTSAELDQERRRINVSVQEEQRRREAERSSYRGPGRYRHRGGYLYEVPGRAQTPIGELVVLRRLSDYSGRLLAVSISDFEDDGPEGRAYEYLGPLGDGRRSVIS